MRQTTEPVAARIDPEDKEKLEQAAAECGVSVSTYLKHAIKEHIFGNPYGLRSLEPSSQRETGEEESSADSAPENEFIEEMLESLE